MIDHSRSSIALLMVLCTVSLAQAQQYDPLSKANTYQNADNPNYWRNRPPNSAYWQQDVHYKIKAHIDPKKDELNGALELIYTNNSPKDLEFVFFHLYQEAFQPGSYRNDLLKANDQKPYNKAPTQGTTINSFFIGNNAVEYEQDNTVLKVMLPVPLRSGASVTFNIDFTTRFDARNGGRMRVYNTWGNKHFNGVHWYPRIAVYDNKFGWTTDQHLGKEFYGDFGCFDVEMEFPSNYIVGATGFLLNRDEMLPPELRAKLDLKNFKDNKWNSPPSEIIPYDSTAWKIWKYHAENVHDFAFTADPSYRIGEAEWNGVKCYALALEPHAAKWQNAAEYTAKIIKTFSEGFGMYTYHKMIVADARDGMEYPMLTLDSGKEPGYRGLFVHEVGHNWFFGQVGNNETYRAALDEGFTQFLTAWGLEVIDGDTMVVDTPKTKYEQRYKKPRNTRESNVYYGYLRDAIKEEDGLLNVHSDGYGSALDHGGGYGHVYFKTATMLYNLQYVLGDDLFLAAMQHYFQQWKIAHPYPEDFRNSIIQFTQVDLNWFFDQWMETRKNIDYAVKKIENKNKDEGQIITIERKGSMQMPVDFIVISRSGETYQFHVPNNWFEKKTNATVLPRWIGWDKLNPTYEAKVDIPSGIREVRIDTTYRLADVNQLNNSNKLNMKVGFDSHIYNRPDRRAYEAFVRPDLWYNGFDGAKVGIHWNSNYLKYKHKVHLSAWLNTGLGQNLPDGKTRTNYDDVSYNFRYSTGTEKISKGSNIFVSAKYLDGLQGYGAGFNKRFRNQNTSMRVELKAMYRSDSTALNYLINPGEWEVAKLNNSMRIGVEQKYKYVKGKGTIDLGLRSNLVGSGSDLSYFTLKAVNHTKIGKTRLRTRVFARYGTGSSVPAESALYLAGASPEELMDNKYTRSIGFIPHNWMGYGAELNHFQAGGGLNLRGYAGYLAPNGVKGDTTILTYRGNSGASFSGELDLDGLVRWHPRKIGRYLHLDAYLFGDVGVMGYTNATGGLSFADIRSDAGIGFALSLKKFGPLSGIKPLTIRFDMPLVMSNIPASENDYFAFRYVVGINRTF